jgi:hypothetical protein
MQESDSRTQEREKRESSDLGGRGGQYWSVVSHESCWVCEGRRGVRDFRNNFVPKIAFPRPTNPKFFLDRNAYNSLIRS